MNQLPAFGSDIASFVLVSIDLFTSIVVIAIDCLDAAQWYFLLFTQVHMEFDWGVSVSVIWKS
jgi:hypothetical protein